MKLEDDLNVILENARDLKRCAIALMVIAAVAAIALVITIAHFSGPADPEHLSEPQQSLREIGQEERSVMSMSLPVAPHCWLEKDGIEVCAEEAPQ